MFFSALPGFLSPYPPYRLTQAEDAIYRRLISSWQEATELPADLRVFLSKNCPLAINAHLFASRKSSARKAALLLPGDSAVETVLMRHEDNRHTICVSSQVGCALGCVFCATGQLGFKRNLTADEIIVQIFYFARLLRQEGKKINNVVFMGMGEPFLNYDNVRAAILILLGKIMIGSRHISVSTVGIVPGIKKFTAENWQVNLAFSLHAPNDKLRQRLMPVARQYPLTQVLPALKLYLNKTRRRLMIEYLLLDGVNDAPEHARELVNLLLKNLPPLFFINLITYNGIGQFRPSNHARKTQFCAILKKAGLTVSQRYRFGVDIKAACGELAGQAVK